MVIFTAIWLALFGTCFTLTGTAWGANAATLVTTINTWAHGGTGNLSASASGSNTVIVTGTVTNAMTTLTLDIDSGVTVKWQAELTGITGYIHRISLTGAGTFEVESGKISSNNGTASGTIYAHHGDVIVNGGTVSYIIAAEGNVTVNGGAVGGINSGGDVVKVNDGTVGTISGSFVDVIVNGGTVSSIGISGDATVNGGTVRSIDSTLSILSDSVAISANNVTVNGGSVSRATVRAAEGTGPYTKSRSNGCESETQMPNNTASSHSNFRPLISNWYYKTISANGNVTISGGLVFGYGTSISSSIRTDGAIIYTPGIYNPAGNSVVVAWDNTGSGSYMVGTADDLTIDPLGTVTWGISGEASGISYNNGINTGFFKVDGVTVSVESIITITTQPEAITYVTDGSITGSLSVMASVSPIGTLSYQWYSNTSDSNTGGTAITGKTGVSFTIPTTLTVTGGPYYYYCVVSSPGVASKTSNVARVMVNSRMPHIPSGDGGGCDTSGSLFGILALVVFYALRLGKK